MSRRLITLFTDVSVLHTKPKRAAWAFWAKTHGREVLRGGAVFKIPITHVHHAEYAAYANALTQLESAGWLSQESHVLWQTDCMAAIAASTTPKGANCQNVFRVVSGLLTRVGATSSVRHVKGHRHFVDPRAAVNTYCDTAAKRILREAYPR